MGDLEIFCCEDCVVLKLRMGDGWMNILRDLRGVRDVDERVVV